MSDLRPSGQTAPEPVRETDDARPAAPAEPRRAFAEPPPQRRAPAAARPAPRYGLEGQIALAAEPLPDPADEDAFGRFFDRFGDARVVLLGEASHGAAEFCRARAAITRWLVEKRGFNIVALEADWTDARVLDARVRGRRPPAGAPAFTGFPAWRWRNSEFDAFLGWLTAHNRGRSPGQQVGVCGLDLYNLSASMRAVAGHLDRIDPDAGRIARERYGCLTPWAGTPQAYGRAAVSGRYAASEAGVTAMLTETLARQMRETVGRDEALLDAAESARLVRDAEAYYRAMYYGGGEAWNLRGAHMHETLKAVLAAGGPDAKAVVWAHNAHVGDARATDMGTVGDEVNLGQLCRQTWGDEARLIGFGAHAGTIACADDWDAPMAVKAVQPALPDSHERLSHDAGGGRFLLDLRPHVHSALRRALAEPRLERFIGAVYRPESERANHYAACRLPEQFDAWVWFDETTAVTPLGGADEAPSV